MAYDTMVFGLRLFSSGSTSSGRSSSGSPSAGASDADAASSAASASALTPADSLPPDAAVCPSLSAVPAAVVRDYPALALSQYNLTRPEQCANVLALAHNAGRLEMADM